MKIPSKAKEGLDQRKKDHIDLALSSQVSIAHADPRFYYEPLLSSHPSRQKASRILWAGKGLKYPIWVSSMTGGTAAAGVINKRLGKVCKEFGIGMGLGSCRIILDNTKYLKDFNIRKYTGNEVPLFANLGIAQMEAIHKEGSWEKVTRLIDRLDADGLIIHVNPLQELLQPEGDPILIPPIETIQSALLNLKVPIIIKEVGQGMGPSSLEALLQLPLEAIEFAALGGTNFSNLELKRQSSSRKQELNCLSQIGHSALEMTEFINNIGKVLGKNMKCKKFIVSGGVKDFLDGYYLIHKIKYPAIYGQASSFLQPARDSYQALTQYVKTQIEGLEAAYAYLQLR